MSVYTKIKSAVLNQRPTSPIYLLIQSNQAILKTIETPSSKTPFWQSSFICSIKQRYLHFKMCYNPTNPKIPSLSSIEELKNCQIYAVGELPFQYFQYEPAKEKLLKLELVRDNKGEITKQGYLELLVYYDPNKNYIGQMEFYEFGYLGPKNVVKNTNNDANTHKIGFKQENPIFKSKVSSVNGSAKSRNLFSCCDVPVQGHEYQILQPHYIVP